MIEHDRGGVPEGATPGVHAVLNSGVMRVNMSSWGRHADVALIHHLMDHLEAGIEATGGQGSAKSDDQVEFGGGSGVGSSDGGRERDSNAASPSAR